MNWFVGKQRDDWKSNAMYNGDVVPHENRLSS